MHLLPVRVPSCRSLLVSMWLAIIIGDPEEARFDYVHDSFFSFLVVVVLI